MARLRRFVRTHRILAAWLVGAVVTVVGCSVSAWLAVRFFPAGSPAGVLFWAASVTAGILAGVLVSREKPEFMAPEPKPSDEDLMVMLKRLELRRAEQSERVED